MEKGRVVEGYSIDEQELFDSCVERVNAILGYGTYTDATKVEVTEYSYVTDTLKIEISSGVSYWSDNGGDFMSVSVAYADTDGHQTEEFYDFGNWSRKPNVKTRTANPARQTVNGQRPMASTDMEELTTLLDLVMTDPEITKIQVSNQLKDLTKSLRGMKSLTARGVYWTHQLQLDRKSVTIGSRYNEQGRKDEWVVTVVEDSSPQDWREYDIVWEAPRAGLEATPYVEQRGANLETGSRPVSLADTSFIARVIDELQEKSENALSHPHPDLVRPAQYDQLAQRAHNLAHVVNLKLTYDAAVGHLRKEFERDSTRFEALSRLDDDSIVRLIRSEDNHTRLRADETVIQAIRALIQTNLDSATEA